MKITGKSYYPCLIHDLRDKIFDFEAENESLGGKIGEVDEKWLNESR
jgi:hypothetical protein